MLWRTIVVLVCFIGLMPTGPWAADFMPHKAFDGLVHLSVPATLSPVPTTGDDTQGDGVGERSEMFSNPSGSVSLNITRMRNPYGDSSLEEIRRAFAADLRGSFPAATWYRDAIVEIHGARFMFMEVQTPMLDARAYNLILGAPLGDELLLIAYKTDAETRKEWMPVGYEVFSTVRISRPVSVD